MTSGEPSTGPAKAKIIGFGLIGLGAIAGVVGIATLFSSGDPSNSAQPLPPESSTNAPVTSFAPSPPSSPVLPPPPSATPPVIPESPPVVPPQTAPNQDLPVGSGDAAAKILVRVYNNSTISGLAHRAAEDFRLAGYEVPEVGNYSAGRIPTTTIYFRPGLDEERQAKDLAARVGARAEPRFDGIQDATPGLIAIITNDYKGTTATK
ncbi:LytR C-terminal domain-containing protein [Saccharopolyspora sp. K220]|uniref:LytR C-terminal domain-containing protein n=1 Tax=Saccharopolyspora soli TaxID=2926618 RepID=UPI001F5A120C|nr:LytR C-terminal domain-containing protein [Saccharopolyspora soli]MCI2422588.1 LytR C-terminal domain-containing protein [Saccharopolyspora soli]